MGDYADEEIERWEFELPEQEETAVCPWCKKVKASIPRDIYGLCEECGEKYAQSLKEMNAEDESSRGLTT